MSREERIAYWSEQNKLWELSGKSQKDFCNEHGLCLRKFVYWRCDVIKKNRAKDFKSRLYKVSTPSQALKLSEQPERLEVLLPGGIKIYINSDLDIQRTSRLIKLLGGA
ncbi:MAG: hypothetical protein P1U74_03240 [Legionellaceae bacterium]|nr:hypothetical protein [Legionellaceae bacterium]